MTSLPSGTDPDQNLRIVLLSYLVSPKEDLLNCLCNQRYPEIVRWMKIAFSDSSEQQTLLVWTFQDEE